MRLVIDARSDGASRRLDGACVWVLAKGYVPDEGGMQTYAQGVAEAYAALGARVLLFTQTSLGPREVRLGVVDVIDLGQDRSPLVLWRFCRALRAARRAFGAPTFIHATTWRTAVPALLLGYPYSVTFHGREFMYARGLMLGVMRLVARRAVRCVAVSRFSAEKLHVRLGKAAPAIDVAWNGVTPGLPAPVLPRTRADTPLLFSLCRLEPRKNIESAVRAAAHCHRTGHAFRYIIGGRGPDSSRIAALAAALPRVAGVEMAGYVDQARAHRFYAAADIFLHPQISIDEDRDFEGFGIAIADAMYCGQAVIVGRDGGPPEFVANGETGLVVDGRDPQALAAALDRLLADPDLRARIGEQAARWARANLCWIRHVEIVMGHRIAAPLPALADFGTAAPGDRHRRAARWMAHNVIGFFRRRVLPGPLASRAIGPQRPGKRRLFQDF